MKKSLVFIAAMLGILATQSVAEEQELLPSVPRAVMPAERATRPALRTQRERQPAVTARQAALAQWQAASGASRSAPKGLDKNVRIEMKVQRENGESDVYSIITSGQATLDSVSGTVEFDGNQLPIIQRIDADIRSVGENEYVVKLIFGKSSPIVTSSTSKTEGETRSTFQYQDVGVESVLRMILDEEVMLLKSPEKSITLRLEALGE